MHADKFEDKIRDLNTSELYAPLVGVLRDVLRLYSETEDFVDLQAEDLEPSFVANTHENILTFLNELDVYLSEAFYDRIFDWAVDVLEMIISVARGAGVGVTPATTRMAEALMARARECMERLRAVREEWALREQTARWREAIETTTALAQEAQAVAEAAAGKAKVAAGEATGSAGTAMEAAGLSGSASLSQYFSEYATTERRAATRYRWATIAGIALSIGYTVAHSLARPLSANDLPDVLLRLAIVAGLATLFAYLARQSGQHRRIANWAKSMEVQLKSFPAFIEPVAEDERGAIYRSFALRVLGAPPEKAGEQSDDNLPAAQLLDLVTTLAKKVP